MIITLIHTLIERRFLIFLMNFDASFDVYFYCGMLDVSTIRY